MPSLRPSGEIAQAVQPATMLGVSACWHDVLHTCKCIAHHEHPIIFGKFQRYDSERNHGAVWLWKPRCCDHHICGKYLHTGGKVHDYRLSCTELAVCLAKLRPSTSSITCCNRIYWTLVNDRCFCGCRSGCIDSTRCHNDNNAGRWYQRFRIWDLPT